jgi:acyl carrier protein
MNAGQSRRVADIESLVARLVEPELEHAPGRLDPDSTFTDLGLDSTGIIAVAEGLTDVLGIRVVPEMFFDHPTIAQLAQLLAEIEGGRAA